eukprot:3940738-Lingulodinium_polyedra.AAC.1
MLVAKHEKKKADVVADKRPSALRAGNLAAAAGGSSVVFEHGPTYGAEFQAVDATGFKLTAANKDVPLITRVPVEHETLKDLDA